MFVTLCFQPVLDTLMINMYLSLSRKQPSRRLSIGVLLLCVVGLAITAACSQSDPTATPAPTSTPPPTATPTVLPTPAPTLTPTPTLSPTPTPTVTPTAPPTPTPTPAPTLTPTPPPTPTVEPTVTPSPEPTPTPDEDGIIWYGPEPATISVEGSIISFVGSIESETYRNFLYAVRGQEDQITAIQINSGGGITDQGMLIGEWIFDHELDVIVDEICFSSCANYIFPAGKNKIIEEDAIVGWHGSEQQDPFIAAGYGITLEELYGRNYDEMKERGETLYGETKEEFVRSVMEADEYDEVDEPEYLDKIGVNLYLMVYGFLPEQFDYYYSDDTHFGGWTFSIEDMAKFGVDNVTYEGEGLYPSGKALENFPLAVFDVLTETIPPAVVPTPIPAPTPPPGSTPTPTPNPEAGTWVEPSPAQITVEGDTVVIDGYIDFDAHSRFRSAIRGKEDQITTLKITSDDGVIDPATLIGLWVHDNEVDVIVEKSCFYVCANYIFTAAKNKVIAESAIVAWLQSPQWEEYDARTSGITIEETMRRDIDNGSMGIDPSLDEKEQEEHIREIAEYVREAIELERHFLDVTGINEDALVYGYVGVEWGAGWLPMHLFLGWTFSIEDMAKLGIENVTYNGSGTYPDLRAAQQREVTIFRLP